MNLLTSEEKVRLAKLAIALGSKNGPEKYGLEFDMSDYHVRKDYGTIDPDEVRHDCGTSCCALGFAPLVLRGGARPRANENWNDYGGRLFPSALVFSGLWGFLFGPNNPNSISEFRKRALFVLQDRQRDCYDRKDCYSALAELKWGNPRQKDFQPYLKSKTTND